MRPLGIVVGLAAEARLARRLAPPAIIAISGATAEGAGRAVRLLQERGAGTLMSFGLAAGLHPGLHPGTLLLPRAVRIGGRDIATASLGLPPQIAAERGTLLHSDALVTEPARKAALFAATGCVALDMESGVVAAAASASGLALLVLRAVCDPAWRSLPPAASLPLGPGGRVSGFRVAGSILRRPGQLPELIRVGRDAGLATQALRDAIGSLPGRPPAVARRS